ncbi:MAG: hypothetical protein C0582_02840 [Alphaproteobacteria bacterium]|nr:MAG: hypothetical protein C0582_02840 [Alphaproteobacteria bacterium]
MIIPSYKLGGLSATQLTTAQGYLFYADDFGLVEFYQRVFLSKVSLEPLQVVRQDTLLGKGKSLVSHLSQESMFQKRAHLIIQGCTDKIVPEIEDYLENVTDKETDIRFICQANYLKPASKLRKLFDQRPTLISCGCYAPSDHELALVVRSLLKTNYGLDIDPTALSVLAYLLTDQLYHFTSVAEILKGINETGCVSEDEVRAVVSPSKHGQFDVFLHAFLARHAQACLRELKWLFRDGHSVISQLRLLGVFMQRWLGLIVGLKKGLSIQEANRQEVVPPFMPYQLKKIAPSAKLWCEAECFKVIERIHEMEQVIKKNSWLQAETYMMQTISQLISLRS